MAESQLAWANTLTYGLSELSRFVEVHDMVAHLENAVQLLVASQLTPALIPVADVERILANVSARSMDTDSDFVPQRPRIYMNHVAFNMLVSRSRTIYIREYISIYGPTNGRLNWSFVVDWSAI
jgi:hypothetical protein